MWNWSLTTKRIPKKSVGADINSFGWKIPLVNLTQLICVRPHFLIRTSIEPIETICKRKISGVWVESGHSTKKENQVSNVFEKYFWLITTLYGVRTEMSTSMLHASKLILKVPTKLRPAWVIIGPSDDPWVPIPILWSKMNISSLDGDPEFLFDE